ncbi:hypothetical protein ACIHCQ_28840 [Streptomyces sp. NPDC052236]|uniref:hypothetical protein n=1 Tax=Streptomyces sp. NPDC052236 TaxID=3365686 RepID=UPI0037D044ED
MTEPLGQEKNPHAQARLLLAGREIAVPGHCGGAALHVTAAVAPDPQRMTMSSSVPPTKLRMIRRASSRNPVVCSPVLELAVYVWA